MAQKGTWQKRDQDAVAAFSKRVHIHVADRCTRRSGPVMFFPSHGRFGQTAGHTAEQRRANLQLAHLRQFVASSTVADGQRPHSQVVSHCTGHPDTPTPIGHFRVIQKSADWGGGFGTRWLGLDVPFGIYGIHGTNKPHLIGQSVSSGCIRMRNRDVEELYDLVPLNTPVVIDGPILGAEGLNYRILVQGSRGSLVQMVQNRLKAGHYYNGPVNGLYDRATEQAVRRYQEDHQLLVTGQIHFADLVELGIVE